MSLLTPDTYGIEMNGGFSSCSITIGLSFFVSACMGTCSEETQVKDVGYSFFLKNSFKVMLIHAYIISPL